MISPEYFTAMGIPIITGRAFTDADDAGGMPVAIVSQGMAKRHWPEKSAVGAHLRVRDDNDTFRYGAGRRRRGQRQALRPRAGKSERALRAHPPGARRNIGLARQQHVPGSPGQPEPRCPTPTPFAAKSRLSTPTWRRRSSAAWISGLHNRWTCGASTFE